ncbi:MAG: hypothetical protein AB7I33_09820 [Gemmatimonadales bacterium]
MIARFRWLTLALVAAVAAAPARAQVSPGPLARPHQAFEGPLQCTRCHGGRNVAMNRLCLDCHKEISWLIGQGRGLHATNPEASCAGCHPDHAGRDFKLISWPGGSTAGFDHRRTGWALEAGHAEVKCEDCHTDTYRHGEAARLAPGHGGPGWTGLERDCVSCHEDVHRNSLGTRCDNCHEPSRWNFAAKYDHVNSRYPLTGKHADVSCDACHKPPARNPARNAKGEPVPIFRPLQFAECSSCHADAHRGRFGTACSECHTTRGFKLIGKETFSHERTRYPLRGRHASVACDRCHDPRAPEQWKPAFATCGSCHPDAHAGQATIAGKAVDCAQCHTVEGFRPGTFSVASHRSTRYPLEGRHQQVACSACHVRRPAGAELGTSHVLLRPAFATCRSCHADDHGSQLATRPDSGACSACHTVAGWNRTTWPVERHASLRVTLEGKHGAAACAACHGPDRPGLPPLPARAVLGRAGVAIRVPEVRCAECHADPHAGRFSPGGASPVQGGCAACHDQRGFRSSTIGPARHDQFNFTLTGAHRAVPCSACHDDTNRPPVRTTLIRSAGRMPPVLLKTRGNTCASCHASPHGTEFESRKDKGACESCHTADAFKPAARFDHDRETAFPLRGQHARVACERCHTPARENGRTVLRYRPVPTRCEACHTDSQGRSR